jgi:hypothetical protein
MINTEREILLVLYVLYLWDCIHWLSIEQVAFVRLSKRWVRKQINPLSFTLLGRMPVLRNPIFTSPGLIISNELHECLDVPLDSKRLRKRILMVRRELFPLSVCAGISATYLLLILPTLLLIGLFAALWKILALTFLLLHLLVIAEFYIAAREWREKAPKSFAEILIAICLNPLTAIRSADTLMNWEFSKTKPAVIEAALCR